jgi:hypothetical protein
MDADLVPEHIRSKALIQPPPLTPQPVPRALSAARRQEHGAAHARGLRAKQAGKLEHGYYSREAKAERQRVKAAAMLLRYLRIMEGFGDRFAAIERGDRTKASW